MTQKVKIGISSCLLGKTVRYNRENKQDHFLSDTFGKYIEWAPVCPEVEYGLPVPREPMHLVGEPDAPCLVTVKTKIDHTNGMLKWIKKKTKDLEQENLCGFIFKSKSPSCDIRGVKVYFSSGKGIKKSAGIFGGAFMTHFPLIPVEDETRLYTPGVRENFIERVFVFKRWQEVTKNKNPIKGLVSFHKNHKLLILAHSPEHYRSLENLVANKKRYKRKELLSKYIQVLMEGLKLTATVKKNSNERFY